MRQPPHFWYDEKGWQGRLLAPLGWLYHGITQLRHRWTQPWQASVPVLCVGNLTLGGTGKTPFVLYLAQKLQERGHKPHIVSRGYGGTYGKACVRVDPTTHSATLVGDEPLLLAAVAPTWICPNRRKGIQAAINQGADCVILDDGFQNPSIQKDFSILVIDGPVGFGNGQIFPAGPLRESIPQGLSRAQMVCILGETSLALQTSLPLLHGVLEPVAPLPTTPVIAFAGIGRPDKFFTMLKDKGVILAAKRAFPDHHAYTAQDLQDLKALQQEHQARLVTTLKDFVRLPPDFATTIEVIPVHLVLDHPGRLIRAMEALFHA